MQQPSDLFGTVTITRYAAGAWTSGEWVEGTGTDIDITANVQPMPSERMQALPEARRGVAGVMLYTDTALKTVDEDAGTSPDRVTWDGYTWEVVSVENLMTGIGLEEAHYEIGAVRK